ncbi:hypothetical protein Leryth_007656 [Lithospermum erythrorhizon]|nr:hypothetical protein Leryth_007656 [Lithospermum erythrorhizon]
MELTAMFGIILVGGRWLGIIDYCDADTFEVGSVDAWAFRADNTDLLLDMEDENGNIKLSDWSTEFLKAKADERTKLSAERASVGVVEFNLEEEDSDSSSDCDTGDVEEAEAMDMPTEENFENEEEHEGSDEDSEYDVESEEDDEE